jgi:hypothetical protein
MVVSSQQGQFLNGYRHATSFSAILTVPNLFISSFPKPF